MLQSLSMKNQRFVVRSAVAVLLWIVVIASPRPALAQIKAFPQAEGFGAAATGGRGGDVYHVTKLTDDGSFGTLRHGIEQASGPRTIVFDVGGWIDLNSKLGVVNDNITIAGQTAPGGVGIRGDQVSVGAQDVVMRHLRFRPGKDAGRVDSVNTNSNAQRVIYDHISTGFSYDENFSVQGNNITLQYSSVAYGMVDHSAGSLIMDAGNLSFHHNLYAHNETRNPKARAALIDWRDNIAYDYHNGFIAGDSQNSVDPHWKANFDGNTYISDGRPMMTGGRDFNYDLFYGVNALDRDGDSTDDAITYERAAAMTDQSVVSSAYNWVTDAFPAPEVWQSAGPAAAYERVLAEFGATPWARDEVDQLVHDNVVNRSGARVSHEDQLPVSNNGYPTLGGLNAAADSDGDGMPDAWETKHGTNPSVPNNNGDFDYDGYTDLEEYLNDLAAFAAIGPLEFSGIGRYADSGRWTHDWEPSRLDEVHITNGAAFVDAVGQKAGTLVVGSDRQGGGRLYLTSGWLEVSDGVVVNAGDLGKVDHYGGELRVLTGAIGIRGGAYHLRGGTLTTPQLNKQPGGRFEFLGGVLDADSVSFDLEVAGGELSAGVDAIGAAAIGGDLVISSGGLAVDLLSASEADQFTVNGEAVLGGALSVGLLDGFAPSASQSWEILTAGAISGEFDSVTPGFTTEQVDGSLWLVAGPSASAGLAPEPSALVFAAGAAAAIAAAGPRRRLGPLVVLALALTASTRVAQAELVTAGELLVDLRAADLEAGSSTWVNQDETGQTVGDFSTGSGGSLNVASAGDVNQALLIDASSSNALLSSGVVPSSVAGNGTRSVEAWVYANGLDGSQSVLSYGATSTNEFSRFTYAGGGNGLLSGWFNDVGWGGATLPVGEWAHVAWTYNSRGDEVRGYVNGELQVTSAMPSTLDTAATVIALGASRTDASADPFNGYIADVRLHTGLLSESDVLNNFNEGLAIGPSNVGGDYNSDGVVGAADYVVWRDKLAASSPSLVNEEVSPLTVDVADYLYWRERYGATDSGAPAPVAPALPVPEPLASALLSGLLALVAPCRNGASRTISRLGPAPSPSY